MMRFLFILIAALSLLTGAIAPAAHGQTAEELLDSGQLIIRTRLEPEGPVLVGQKTTLWIEIFTSTWFTSAPQLPQTLEIPNAVVLVPASSSVNRSERIGGTTFAGQARRYLIYPQGPGLFETPVVPLTLTVALESGGSSPELSLRAPVQRFEAQPPPGSEGLGLVLAAPELTVSEQWDPARPEELRVGEAVTRQVTQTIDDAVAMLLPPLEMVAVEGIGLYPGKPEIDDRSNRGQLTGTRTDSVTLVMEEEGNYELPEVVFHWYDLEQGELRREVLPAVSFTVAANPDLAAEHLGESPEQEESEAAAVVEKEDDGTGLRNIILAGGAFLLLLLIFRRRIAGLPAALARWKRRREEDEARYFEHFRQAAGKGDPAETMAALVAWLDRFAMTPGAATLQWFVDGSGDPELADQAEALSHELYGGSAVAENDAPREPWSGKLFLRLAARARKKILSGRGDAELRPAALPPLNPGADGNR